ncbi:hypothetical protein FIBSPDRAFT_422936 [Athelia psychrophila]|uniref:Uncharacterized protein n=1 Tax=Athelia psychrophila TaxID=1759441 RepID=A0A166MX38_9AGAM|nr:hypothetical protein FIBSPDRAFT_422936 [Fibularhizoctonia sp. CBS 109695]
MHTAQDTRNAVFAVEAVKLDDVPWFTSLERVVDIGTEHESPTFAHATASSARASRPPPFSPPPHSADPMSYPSALHPKFHVLMGVRCAPTTSPSHRAFRSLNEHMWNLQRMCGRLPRAESNIR